MGNEAMNPPEDESSRELLIMMITLCVCKHDTILYNRNLSVP